MAPLTSLSGWNICAHLPDKIELEIELAELERRISTIYQIKEAEKFMDIITFGPAQTDATCARVLLSQHGSLLHTALYTKKS